MECDDIKSGYRLSAGGEVLGYDRGRLLPVNKGRWKWLNTVSTPHNPPMKMSRDRDGVLGLLPKTECSEWFVLGLEFAGLWVYPWSKGDDWWVSVYTTKPDIETVAVNASTSFYGKTVQNALMGDGQDIRRHAVEGIAVCGALP